MDKETELRPGSIAASRGPRAVRSHRELALAARVVAAMAAAYLIWIALHIPVDVPDAASPPISNHAGLVTDWRTVVQSFVVERDGLNQISLILAATERGDMDISLNIKERPDGAPIRTVRRSLLLVPEGDPMELASGLRTEHWETFQFEPIPDSGGRRLYLSVEGSEGMTDDNPVNVLAYFHSQYPEGEAYLSGEPANAHVVFRAQSRAQVIDYLQVLVENLSIERPGVLSSPAAYAALVVVYALFAVGTLWVIGRMRVSI